MSKRLATEELQLVAFCLQESLVVVKVLREGRLVDVDTVDPPAPLADLLSAFSGTKIVNEAGNRVIVGPLLAGMFELHEAIPLGTAPQLCSQAFANLFLCTLTDMRHASFLINRIWSLKCGTGLTVLIPLPKFAIGQGFYA